MLAPRYNVLLLTGVFRKLLKEFIAVPILRDVPNKEAVIVKRYCHTELFSFPQFIIIQLKIRINGRAIPVQIYHEIVANMIISLAGEHTPPPALAPFTDIHGHWSWREGGGRGSYSDLDTDCVSTT